MELPGQPTRCVHSPVCCQCLCAALFAVPCLCGASRLAAVPCLCDSSPRLPSATPCVANPLRIGAVCLMASPLPLVSMDYDALPWPLVSLRRLSSQGRCSALLLFASPAPFFAIPCLRFAHCALPLRLVSQQCRAFAMLGLPSPCHCVASLRHAVAGLCFSIAILLNAMRCLSSSTPRLAWPLPFPSFAHCAVPLRFVVILLVATPPHRFEMECFASAEQLVAMLSRSRASSASHA